MNDRFQNLRVRVITAVVLASLFALIGVLSAYWCAARIGLVALGLIAVLLCAGEFAVFSSGAGAPPSRPLMRGWTIFYLALPAFWTAKTMALFPCDIRLSAPIAASLFAKGVLLSFVLLMLSAVYAGRQAIENVRALLAQALPALCLIGAGGGALVGLALLQDSPRVLFWLVLVVSINDIAAYFGGSYFGGPKLAPALSPKKTLSGSACGLAGGLAAGILFGVSFGFQGSLLRLTGTILLVVAAAQVGDLLKSYLKRLSGVKDSSALLPGHGGVLDRLDGILAGSIVALLWW